MNEDSHAGSGAICFDFPTIIKAHTDNGRRIVEVEASNEICDAEGDVVLQSALLAAAPQFIASGHLDLDHLSEIGGRIGIPNPASYIVGVPLEVKDIGEGRTSVVGEISRDASGKSFAAKNKFDEFWESMVQSPPVRWQSSIYGYPHAHAVDDCSEVECGYGASRYLIKGIEWRSLAFTRNPINTSLKGHATRIITAKAYIDEVRKTLDIPEFYASNRNGRHVPRSIDELLGQYDRHISKACPVASGSNSRICFRDHFQNCCGMDTNAADIMANALMMQLVDRLKKRKGNA